MLGPVEIKRGAERTCAAWRRVAVDDPALWRRIDMGKGGLAVFLRRTGGCARRHGSRRRGLRSLLGAMRQPLALLSGSMKKKERCCPVIMRTMNMRGAERKFSFI
ncbi:hypothetical protein PVAP13_6KG045035 [Panicum virgatum]|uniref:F-box domain-containing protein n=1 Tax=Panicum virgatum TaxID=38727 RepID=A0A8T0R9S1_PANVG|nr:hypothetical protein PVAP13_6KG045035 [Panicum virgatum]